MTVGREIVVKTVDHGIVKITLWDMNHGTSIHITMDEMNELLIKLGQIAEKEDSA